MLQNLEFIRFAILILNFLVKNGFANNHSNDHKLFNIISVLNQIFDIFKLQINYINNDKLLLSKLQDALLKREADLLNIDNLFSNILSKYPDLSIIPSIITTHNTPNNTTLYTYPIINPNSFHSLDDLLTLIKNHISNNPSFSINFKNLLSINILKNTIIKFGGIKNISKSYYNLFNISTNITSNITTNNCSDNNTIHLI